MRIALVAYPGCQVLDVTGPFEAFSQATEKMNGSFPAFFLYPSFRTITTSLFL